MNCVLTGTWLLLIFTVLVLPLHPCFQAKNVEKFALTFNEYGRLPPTFSDASFLAQQLLESGLKYDRGTIFYNKFKTVVSYNAQTMGFVSHSSLTESGEWRLLWCHAAHLG